MARDHARHRAEAAAQHEMSGADRTRCPAAAEEDARRTVHGRHHSAKRLAHRSTHAGCRNYRRSHRADDNHLVRDLLVSASVDAKEDWIVLAELDCLDKACSRRCRGSWSGELEV